MRRNTTSSFPKLAFLWRVSLLISGLACSFPFSSAGAAPGLEKLLPADTVLVISTKDAQDLRSGLQSLPLARLWRDPAMKPFRDRFFSGLEAEILRPLQREFGPPARSWSNLFQGQFTFALLKEPAASGQPDRVSFTVMAELGEGTNGAAPLLGAWRKSWVDAGKALRDVKIRQVNFFAVQASSNTVPPALGPMLFRPDVQNSGSEWLFGTSQGLLLVGNSPQALEQVLLRLDGVEAPRLEQNPLFNTPQATASRKAPLYGWADFQKLTATLFGARMSGPGSLIVPGPGEEMSFGGFAQASGLSGVRAVSFHLAPSPDGLSWELFADLPDNARTGLMALLSGSAGSVELPEVIPGDALRVQRWSLKGEQVLLGVQSLLAKIAPGSLNGLRTVFATAQDVARFNNSSLDLGQLLTNNLGNELIIIERALTPVQTNAVSAAGSLVLLSSPRPAELADGIKWLMVVLSGTPVERDFRGSRILSVPMPPFHQLWGAPPPAQVSTLHFAPGAGYLALSTRPELVEDFLKGPHGTNQPFKQMIASVLAAHKVVGPGTRWLEISRDAEQLRINDAAWRSDPASFHTDAPGFSTIFMMLGMVAPESSVADWVDIRLLPPVDKLYPYFGTRIRTLNTSPEGIAIKYFAPAKIP